jgi:hypothetical protein
MKNVSRLSMFALIAMACVSSQAAGLYAARTTASTPLSPTGGAVTTVLQVTAPAGTWVVSSKVSFVNFQNKDYDRCQLVAGATPIDGATTMTGDFDGMPAVATLANLGTVTTVGSTTFKLDCWHDFNVPGQSIDADATLVVSRAPKK